MIRLDEMIKKLYESYYVYATLKKGVLFIMIKQNVLDVLNCVPGMA